MPSDPLANPGRRILAMLGLSCLAWVGYLAVARLAAIVHPEAVVTVPPSVPLLPWTFAVYMTLGPLTLLAAWSCEADAFRRLCRAALIAMGIAYACFALCPVAVVHREVAGWWSPAYAWLRGIDVAHNTCPSLHVAYVGLALACRRWPWWIWAWGGGIILSTLTTHQHLLPDAIGGILLAILAWRWSAALSPAAAAAA